MVFIFVFPLSVCIPQQTIYLDYTVLFSLHVAVGLTTFILEA